MDKGLLSESAGDARWVVIALSAPAVWYQVNTTVYAGEVWEDIPAASEGVLDRRKEGSCSLNCGFLAVRRGGGGLLSAGMGRDSRRLKTDKSSASACSVSGSDKTDCVLDRRLNSERLGRVLFDFDGDGGRLLP